MTIVTSPITEHTLKRIIHNKSCYGISGIICKTCPFNCRNKDTLFKAKLDLGSCTVQIVEWAKKELKRIKKYKINEILK